MKNKKWIILAIVVGILVLIGGTVLSGYNGLVNADEAVKKYASDIDADLQRRNDLVPNLVNTVKGYAAHENEIFTQVSNARAQMMSAGTNAEKAAADTAMNSSLSRLLAITENYPDLKANQGFLDLQTQLEGTENRIKVARTKYNEAAQGFNTNIRKFPSSVIASLFGFQPYAYFEATPGSQQVPDVNFGS